MSLHWFDQKDSPSVAWRNGGGQTTELVSWPPESTMTNFDWRISIATIAQAGPFSSFPGIDRSISLLEGEVVLLHWPASAAQAAGEHALTTVAQPFVFEGERAITATLCGASASRDFNVMVRRDTMAAQVLKHTHTATVQGEVQGMLLVVSGRWQVGNGSVSKHCGAGQGVWWINEKPLWQLQPEDDSACLLEVRLWQR